jgi:hypothetical protein
MNEFGRQFALIITGKPQKLNVMKKIIIISATIFLAVTAFAQPGPRGTEKQRRQDHKKEAAVKRAPEKTTNRKAQVNSHAIRESHAGKSRSATTRRIQSGSGTQRSPEAVHGTPGNSRQKNTGKTFEKTMNHRNQPAGRYNPSKANHKPAGDSRSVRHAGHRKHYTTPDRRHVRKTHAVHVNYSPVKYRKIHRHYRVPKRVNVVWTPRMYRDYRLIYPDFHYWYYPTGYRIVTVPYYHAYFHVGEVRNVYGRVDEVWYSWSTDEYYLYFGAGYPYQDFTVILDGREARRFSRHPEAYFGGRYIWVTGLISTFEGKPEILVKRRTQVHLY